MLRHAIFAAAIAATPVLADPSYITFTVPGSTDTSVLDINASGEVLGNYTTAKRSFGFVRHADGSIETLVRRGVFLAINDRGDVLGSRSYAGGFLHRAGGVAKKISVPGVSTYVSALNNAGAVAGYTQDSTDNTQGFVYEAKRHYTFFDLPRYGLVTAISSSGTIAGAYQTSPGYALFLRATDGTLKSFTHPGSEPFRNLSAMNDSGVMTGNLGTVDGSELYRDAFVLSPEGTFEQFKVGGHTAIARDINAGGAVTGYYTASHSTHGFVRAARGAVTKFDCPDAAETYAETINDSGVIAGRCRIQDGSTVGFIRVP